MKLSRFALALGALALTFAPICAGQAYAAPKTVKISCGHSQNSPFYKAYVEMKDMVDKELPGKYKIGIYADSQLGNFDTVFQGIQFGTIHMTFDTTSNLSPFEPSFAVFDLPYLFLSPEKARIALKSEAAMKLLKKLDSRGVTTIGYIPNAMRTLLTIKPLTRLEEAAGLKIRSTPSKTHVATLKSFGINPTPMAAGEMITGLQQGVIDGVDVDMASAYSLPFDDIVKYAFQSHHMHSPYVAFVSTKWWNKLPAEDKAVWEKAAQFFIDRSAELIREMADAGITRYTRKGVTFTMPSAEEKARWIEKGHAIYKDFDDSVKADADAILKAQQ